MNTPEERRAEVHRRHERSPPGFGALFSPITQKSEIPRPLRWCICRVRPIAPQPGGHPWTPRMQDEPRTVAGAPSGRGRSAVRTGSVATAGNPPPLASSSGSAAAGLCASPSAWSAGPGWTGTGDSWKRRAYVAPLVSPDPARTVFRVLRSADLSLGSFAGCSGSDGREKPRNRRSTAVLYGARESTLRRLYDDTTGMVGHGPVAID